MPFPKNPSGKVIHREDTKTLRIAGRGSDVKRNSIAGPLAAMISFLAATSCCLPIGIFLWAAGFAGAAAFVESARPYFMALSIIMLIVGFWQTYGAKRCSVRRNAVGVILLWTATGLIVLMFAFPQLIAGLLADWLTWNSLK